MPPCGKGCSNLGRELTGNITCDLCTKPVHMGCTWELQTIIDAEQEIIDVCGDCYAQNAPNNPFSMGQPSQENDEESLSSEEEDKKLPARISPPPTSLSVDSITRLFKQAQESDAHSINPENCIVQVIANKGDKVGKSWKYILVTDTTHCARSVLSRKETDEVNPGTVIKITKARVQTNSDFGLWIKSFEVLSHVAAHASPDNRECINPHAYSRVFDNKRPSTPPMAATSATSASTSTTIPKGRTTPPPNTPKPAKKARKEKKTKLNFVGTEEGRTAFTSIITTAYEEGWQGTLLGGGKEKWITGKLPIWYDPVNGFLKDFENCSAKVVMRRFSEALNHYQAEYIHAYHAAGDDDEATFPGFVRYIADYLHTKEDNPGNRQKKTQAQVRTTQAGSLRGTQSTLNESAQPSMTTPTPTAGGPVVGGAGNLSTRNTPIPFNIGGDDRDPQGRTASRAFRPNDRVDMADVQAALNKQSTLLMLSTMSAMPLINQDGNLTLESYFRARDLEKDYRTKIAEGGTPSELCEWETRRKAADMEARVYDHALHSRALVYELFHSQAHQMAASQEEEEDDEES